MGLTSAQVYQIKNTINERYGALMERMHEEAVQRCTDTRADANLVYESRVSSAVREIRALEAARARMAVGCLGRCSICEGSIGFDRLLADPAATRCEECEARQASGERAV
ncbi:MAG: hypothetical protein A3I01_15945 [Betaproteobacteria bacterium RIFCSPLOWO2_02_FULL_65_24]|nr:MAG: hypothetical protein A3I01_15945 [Betaproteobacteria bacterium RIFCSPLOWO2_02_FULL_65_24]OGA73917.1 MAG: hypothetical protein A3G27_04980 [Betaproteobacteria bacterium RIFCSPLOWO2_12_FULL_66_14]